MIEVIEWRNGYNHDREAASRESSLECKDVSLAVQSQAAESDINRIVKNFLHTGELPVRAMPPLHADFADVFDFQSAMNTVRAAQEAFMALPAEIRSQFDNDAHAFVEFCNDDSNKESLMEWGLLPRPARDAAEAPVAEPGADTK